MRIRCHIFAGPKVDRSYEECEDAAGHSQVFEESEQQDSFRCVVCDGATESVFSKKWAELLVADYLNQHWTGQQCPDLTGIAREWNAFVDAQELSWNVAEKVSNGAASTLVGLTVSPDGNWVCQAVGDSCLFLIRDGQLVEALPVNSSADFSNFPFLLSSRPERNSKVNEHLSCRSGTWKADDVFLLMSDAVACWFLRTVESGQSARVISHLLQLTTREAFMALVQSERTCRSGAGFNMRDDDVTLVRVQINPSRPASVADPPAMSITLPATDDATAAAQKYSTQEFSFNPNQVDEEPPPRQQVPASPAPNRSAATEDNYSKAKSKSPGILPLLLIAIVAIVVVGGTAFFAGRLSNGPDKPPAIKLPVEKPAADPKQQTSPGTKPASDHPGGKTSAKSEKKKPVKTGKEPPPQHKQDIKDSDLPTSLKGLKDPDDIVHKSTDEAKAKDPAKAPRGGKDGDVIVESGEGIDVTTGSPSKKHRKTEGTDKRTAPQLRPDDEHESKPEPKLFNKSH